MIIRLMTKRTEYGNRKYLIIDTNKHTYSMESDRLIFDGMEVKTRDYNTMVKQCIDAGYKKIH